MTRVGYRQARWALTHWIKPWMYRLAHGIPYDAQRHRPPAEPDWSKDKGRSGLPKGRR